MNLTYFGHSGFQLKIQGKSIVFDPFITPNDLASSISLDGIECDVLLQSHAHEDHIADSVVLAKMTNATVVSCFETTEWFLKQGVENVHPMNIGGSWDFNFFKVKMVNAVHSNSFPDGTYAGQPCGWVIEAEGNTLYYAGDTALTYDMKLIDEEFDLDYALLPIGDNFTMGINDAVNAAKFCGVKNIIGMHFDTFGYIKIDHQEAKDLFQQNGLKLTLLNINDTIEL